MPRTGWLLVAIAAACSGDDEVEPAPPPPGGPAAGDPEAGWEALRYGGFVGAGVPADVWFELIGVDDRNLLEREGRSAGLSASFNLFEAPNGVEVAGGITCFGCHAATIDGVFYPGIGNPRADFVGGDDGAMFEVLELLVDNRYGAGSPEAAALAPFARGSAAVAPHMVAPFVGANPAFSIERAAAAHRDPETLAWVNEPLYEVPDEPLWCDTPPLWHADRKTRLYWTGFGDGQIERMLMQLSVVAVEDVAQAEEILEDFADIRAWMAALEPPPYPGEVEAALAEAGRAVFEANCAECHGTYGEEPAWPERFVPVAEVGTDPVYASGFVDSPFVDWAVESWFGEGSTHPGAVPGYVAPPLDGIWATAPYLHNGSVPDLVSLLDPAQRPARWRRHPSDTSMDHQRVGWPYTEPAADAVDPWTYDTSASGAGNGGHLYGEALSEAERGQVLEYLKTL